jgi:hypothetical protein
LVEQNKKAWDLGSTVHSMLLEGTDIADCLDFDSWRTNASKDAAAKSRENGKIPLLVKDYENVKAVVVAAEEHLFESELHIASLQAEGYSEQSYIWTEGETWCRTRPDWVSSDTKIMIDLKTTGLSADPSNYVRQILAAGTDTQAAFYLRGVKKLTKLEPRFVTMVQEINPPYLCSFISLSSQFMELGKQKVKEGMAIWKECIETGIWPGYSKRIMQCDAPAYAVAQFEDRKFTAELLAQDANSEDGMPF